MAEEKTGRYTAESLGYQYDANSNVTQTTDARGVVSTYAYDALNRNTTIDYSNTASINPDVKWFYDGAINGKGLFWYFYKGGDISVGSNVDHKAIDSYDALGRSGSTRIRVPLMNVGLTPMTMFITTAARENTQC